ncbi:MAG: hypothetical protein MZV64_08565 [Ignavibacteriales bacterium]|nr:hypothetical protein [Ignavibacteriales bacterium]
MKKLFFNQIKMKLLILLMKMMKDPLTPSTTFLGVKIHSGDILLSRGGAPTSALIPEEAITQEIFLMLPLVYVDPKTNVASIIEAHIEVGVAIATLRRLYER